MEPLFYDSEAKLKLTESGLLEGLLWSREEVERWLFCLKLFLFFEKIRLDL